MGSKILSEMFALIDDDLFQNTSPSRFLRMSNPSCPPMEGCPCLSLEPRECEGGEEGCEGSWGSQFLGRWGRRHTCPLAPPSEHVSPAPLPSFKIKSQGVLEDWWGPKGPFEASPSWTWFGKMEKPTSVVDSRAWKKSFEDDSFLSNSFQSGSPEEKGPQEGGHWRKKAKKKVSRSWKEEKKGEEERAFDQWWKEKSSSKEMDGSFQPSQPSPLSASFPTSSHDSPFKPSRRPSPNCSPALAPAPPSEPCPPTPSTLPPPPSPVLPPSPYAGMPPPPYQTWRSWCAARRWGTSNGGDLKGGSPLPPGSDGCSPVGEGPKVTTCTSIV